MAIRDYMTNKDFNPYTNEPGSIIQRDPNFGGAKTAINPATGQREPVVQIQVQDTTGDSGFLIPVEGWASENPGFSSMVLGQPSGGSFFGDFFKDLPGFLGEAIQSPAIQVPLAAMLMGGSLGATAADSSFADMIGQGTAEQAAAGASGTGLAGSVPSILQNAGSSALGNAAVGGLQGITAEAPLGVGTGIPEFGGQSYIDASLPGGYLTPEGIPTSGSSYFDQALLGTAAGGLGALGAGSMLTNAASGAAGSALGNAATSGAAGAAGAGVGSQALADAGSSAALGAAGGALGRILAGAGTAADWASILGTGLASGLGFESANKQADTLRDIANQARNDRAPFLGAATGALADPTGWANTGPAQQIAKAQWGQLSPVFGNPAGAPAAQSIAADAGMKNWQNYVTGMGNMGLAGQDSRMNMQAQAAGAQASGFGDLGWGLENIFNPKPQSTTLADIAKLIGMKNSLG